MDKKPNVERVIRVLNEEFNEVEFSCFFHKDKNGKPVCSPLFQMGENFTSADVPRLLRHYANGLLLMAADMERRLSQ